MLIGELSKQSGFSRDTIRYYEKLGLVTVDRGQRFANGYKNYAVEALERLNQIRHLKQVGFTLQEIRRFLAGDGNLNRCHGLPDRLAEKLSKLDQQIARLREFKASLSQIQRACNGNCADTKGVPGCIPVDRVKPSSGCC